MSQYCLNSGNKILKAEIRHGDLEFGVFSAEMAKLHLRKVGVKFADVRFSVTLAGIFYSKYQHIVRLLMMEYSNRFMCGACESYAESCAGECYANFNNTGVCLRILR